MTWNAQDTAIYAIRERSAYSIEAATSIDSCANDLAAVLTAVAATWRWTR